VLAGGRWGGDGRAVEEGGGLAEVVGAGAGGNALIEAGQLIQSEGPAVAFVFDEALEHSEGGGFRCVGEAAGDVAEEGGYAREVGDLGKEAAYLGVGIFAGLESTE
jgi:hypothetical protein